jgi:hypothetical protein
MATKVIDVEYCKTLNEYVYEYIVDTEADVATLPQCATGSSALVVESGVVYVVNACGEWAVLGG